MPNNSATTLSVLQRLDQPDPIVGGVASSVASRLGASTRLVRTVFCVAALAAGVGLVLYAIAFLLLRGRDLGHDRPVTARHNVGVILGGLAIVALTAQVFDSVPDGLLWPVALVAFGWAFVNETPRAAGSNRRDTAIRVGLGVALGAAGLLTAAATASSPEQLWWTTVTAVVICGGILLIAAPWISGVMADAEIERTKRIRAEERADIAAHIHDSVLQTLTLIQNRANDPQVTAALAHQQERELRSWLYGAGASAAENDSSLRGALERLGAEVEDQYLIVVECIVVGDTERTEPLDALLAATREALVNAAKFSQSQLVSLFAEVGDDKVQAFVRDRGVGFDPDSVDEDRRGITDSIQRRMAKAGGTTAVKSAPGVGTEVMLEMPR